MHLFYSQTGTLLLYIIIMMIIFIGFLFAFTLPLNMKFSFCMNYQHCCKSTLGYVKIIMGWEFVVLTLFLKCSEQLRYASLKKVRS